MKLYLNIILFLIPNFMLAQTENPSQSGLVEVFEVDNTFFRKDNFWMGADGVASIDLNNGKLLYSLSNLKFTYFETLNN